MDTRNFDQIATTVASLKDRRSILRLLGGSAVAAAGFASFAAVDADAKKKKKKRKPHNTNPSTGNTPRDMCPVSAPAPNSPTCGTDPGAGDCTCTMAVEGNNICVGFIDSCAALTECNSTADCRASVGFHFFCQAAGTGSCGQRCVPECGNTDQF